MSADLLRRAAALMRERAQGAEGVMGEGPWSGGILGHDGTSMTYDVQVDSVTLAATIAEELSEHIASWHPAVALAVADWLDDQARYWDAVDAAPSYMEGDPATAVARAYLAEQS